MVPMLLHLLTTAAADDDGHVSVCAKIVERSLDAIKMMIVLMNCDLVPNVELDLAPNVYNLRNRTKSREKEKKLQMYCLFVCTASRSHCSGKHVRALLKLFYSILCDCGKWLFVFPHVINFERTRAVNLVCFSHTKRTLAIAGEWRL